jgi:hypothetical protein
METPRAALMLADMLAEGAGAAVPPAARAAALSELAGAGGGREADIAWLWVAARVVGRAGDCAGTGAEEAAEALRGLLTRALAGAVEERRRSTEGADAEDASDAGAQFAALEMSTAQSAPWLATAVEASGALVLLAERVQARGGGVLGESVQASLAAAAAQLLQEFPHSAPVVLLLDRIAALCGVGADAAGSTSEGNGKGKGKGKGKRQGGGAEADALSFGAVIRRLAPNLLTSDPELRAATLQLLTTLAPPDAAVDGVATGDFAGGLDPSAAVGGVRGVLALMTATETAPMDAIHGKERGQRLVQLRAVIEYGRLPSALLPVAAPFLIGQLRCRFTMPWPAVRDCLVALCKAHPAHAWDTMTEHLRLAATVGAYTKLDTKLEPGDGTGTEDAAGEEEEEEEEEEAAAAEREEARREKKEERRKEGKRKAPRAPKVEQVTVRTLDPDAWARGRMRADARAREFAGTPRVELLVQLLGVFAASPKHVQNHSRSFVQLFLRFLAEQYDPLFAEDQEALERGEAAALGLRGGGAGRTGGVEGIGRTEATRALCGYLEVFAGMSSAEPLAHADVLRGVFVALLAKTHNAVQLQALRALLVWRSPALLPYQPHLENLIDDEKYRRPPPPLPSESGRPRLRRAARVTRR